MTRVVITGAGVVTPVADSPAELHAALCAGADAMRSLPPFAAGLACEIGAVVDGQALRRELAGRPLAGIERTGLLTIVAAQRALASSGLGVGTPSSLGLVLGTMFSSAHTIGEFDRRAQTAGPEFASPLDFANTVLNAAAGQTAIRLSLTGLNTTIAGGHASGLHAIAYASDLIAGGRADVLLAGGVEEVGVESFVGFCRAGMMCGSNGRPGHVPVPFDDARTGFALGEGAALATLEVAAAASARGATVRATVAGWASAIDPDALERGFCSRETIADVVLSALSRAGVDATCVDAVSASANGSFAGDEQEALALADVFGACPVPPAITAIKSVLGETLGASGPLQVVAMLEAMRDGRLPGIRGFCSAKSCRHAGELLAASRPVHIRTAVVTAVSPEGCCSALVLAAPQELP
jgi:3-oxoacyl-[acyl-carrier-protein] synthase II